MTYESLNIASLWTLPVLFVVENNHYAQSTSVELELAGSIPARAAAFGVEAEALDTMLERLGTPVDCAVQLEVPNELLVERIAGRAKAEGRADDSPESVRTRLKVYDEQTAPVVEFYRQHGQLTIVDGVGSLDEVFTRIVEAIAPQLAAHGRIGIKPEVTELKGRMVRFADGTQVEADLLVYATGY